jgi:hypothetical protein
MFIHLLFNDAQDVVFSHDEMFDAVDLDFRAGVFAEENAVARLHVRFYQFPIFRGFALADPWFLTLPLRALR